MLEVITLVPVASPPCHLDDVSAGINLCDSPNLARHNLALGTEGLHEQAYLSVDIVCILSFGKQLLGKLLLLHLSHLLHQLQRLERGEAPELNVVLLPGARRRQGDHYDVTILRQQLTNELYVSSVVGDQDPVVTLSQ